MNYKKLKKLFLKFKISKQDRKFLNRINQEKYNLYLKIY